MGKKIELNYENISIALNFQFEKGKGYNRNEVLEKIALCIPIKSYSIAILSEMVNDGTLKTTRNADGTRLYTVQNFPIYKGKPELWIKHIRTQSTTRQKKTLNGKDVVNYLASLSLDDFIKLIGPECKKRTCKLYIPSGFDRDAINKLPEDIRLKIFTLKEF